MRLDDWTVPQGILWHVILIKGGSAEWLVDSLPGIRRSVFQAVSSLSAMELPSPVTVTLILRD